MDKGAIKKYAIWARSELIERVTQKAYQYGIHEDNQITERIEKVNGRLLTSEEQKQRRQLIAEVRAHGFETVMEEIAYTWFNRFAALRFMEVNGYLPTHIRVFTDDNGRFAPQILTEAVHLELEGLDREKVFAYIEANEKDALYKYLLITQCNALGDILPDMFEKIADYTELLFPENLLREGSVIEQMVTLIPEADWNISVPDEKGQPQGQVEIIGWLYQYYNTVLNEQVYDGNMSKSRVPKGLLPAATTIYTTDWAVQYMVENSLGRKYIEWKISQGKRFDGTLSMDGTYSFGDWTETERQKYEKDLADRLGWKYYLPEAEQTTEVQEQLKCIMQDEYQDFQLENLKVIDPCMGSGHMLIRAFDVLMKIYENEHYTVRDAVQSILVNNLYGVDIDKRAYQLAYFALFMKARQYDRRILYKHLSLNLAVIEESNGLKRWDEVSGSTVIGGEQLDFSSQYFETANYLVDIFQDAKEYGSILNVEKGDYGGLEKFILQMKEQGTTGNLLLDGWLNEIYDRMPKLIKQADLLSLVYDVVITNPPYLGSSRFSDSLSAYVKKNYPAEKADLSMVMLKKSMQSFSKKNGFISFITTSSWMFLSSFEKLRKFMLSNFIIESMVDFGTELFDGKVGHNPITAWVNRNVKMNYTMTAIRLVDYCYSQRGAKQIEYFKDLNRFTARQGNFAKIPGMPIAYWISTRALSNFDNMKCLGDYANCRIGLITGNADRFIRNWYEICYKKIGFLMNDNKESIQSKKKWFPLQNGGAYRNWYGNLECVVNWENDGYDMKYDNFINGRIKSHNYNGEFAFKKSFTWTTISSSKFSCRYSGSGFIFDTAGPFGHPLVENNIFQILAFLNSKVAFYYLKIINPTINFPPGYVEKLPFDLENIQKDIRYRINALAQSCIKLSKTDWDSFETSWDFNCHPLLDCIKNDASLSLSNCYNMWKHATEVSFKQLKTNDEELNNIFIEIYGLQNELTDSIDNNNITITRIYDTKAEIPESMKGNNYVLTKADVIKSFISYAVGCMMGRYSIYKEGLFYAGGPGGDLGSLVEKIQDALHAEGKSRFPEHEFYPDKDAILPICEDEYFEDDIVNLFVKFVSVVYGEDTLAENLQFIADALGGKGTPREVLRSYFLNDFYKDHCKTYQKRPIYWLFDAGKKNSFKALVYLHRYRPDTIARLRTDYVHEQQERYHTAIAQLEAAIDKAASTAESVRLKKKLKKFTEQEAELHDYEEKVHHLADQMISIDLDDGVKKNYAIFQDILAKIK